MFMGPLEVSKPWITSGLLGVSRFLERLWAIGEKPLIEGPLKDGEAEEALLRLLHKTIKKVGHDTETLNFNTAISAMMIYSNELAKAPELPRKLWEPLVLMVSPYAPHLGEELWEKLGHGESVSRAPWPVYEESLTAEREAVIVVQVNGKVRDRFTVPAGTPKEDLEKTALSLPGVLKWIEGRQVLKVIALEDKLVNVVIP
jgi:leucyl-tRNA synthetase